MFGHSYGTFNYNSSNWNVRIVYYFCTWSVNDPGTVPSTRKKEVISEFEKSVDVNLSQGGAKG